MTTNDALIQDYLAAARRGDWEAAFDFMSDDVVLHVPGRSQFAGRHEGKAAMRAYLSEALAGTTAVEVDLIAALAGSDHVALVLRERIARPDRVLEMRRTNVYRIRDGQIVEVTLYEAHQYEGKSSWVLSPSARRPRRPSRPPPPSPS